MRIISGGQTGADIGGLVAAKLHGLDTGGWMPKGWITQDGNRPEYSHLFGMIECEEKGYKARTWRNIRDSDGTIRIAKDFGSAGERCTLNGIVNYGKPSLDIDVKDGTIDAWKVDQILNWISDNKINTLNVAGNSHKTWQHMQSFTVLLLSYVFIDMGYSRVPLDSRYNFLANTRTW